jgi:rhodanese-related sulfurtransferase
MTKLLLLAALAAISACTKADSQNHNAPAPAPAPTQTQTPTNLATATVDEVDASLAKGDVQPVDANGEATRKKMGVLPGAVLLTDSDAFQLSELPADKAKSLVFYCANTACGASHHAAEKAIAAGYQHVRVMPEGIAGWVQAGKKTQSI